MTDEISGTKAGNGFLDAAGNVKPRDVLAREDAAPVRGDTDSNDEAASSEDLSLDRALQNVSAKFNRGANEIASALNQQRANVEAAQRLVKDEIAAAKDLKQALENGNDKKVEAAKKQIAELEIRRAEIQKQTESDNRGARDTNGVLALGNKVQGVVRVAEVKLAESPVNRANLDEVRDVDKLIDALKDERKGLNIQKKEIRQAAREVGTIVKSVSQQVGQIRSDSIRSIRSAEQNSAKIAGAIGSAGAQALVAHNINDQVVQRVLAEI